MRNYDIIFITNLPAFYKLNLFNRIAIHKKIFVVFTNDKSSQRNSDFYGNNFLFEFKFIATKNYVNKIIYIHNLLRKFKYKQLILGGWDHLVIWYTLFNSPKYKNSLIVESSILESEISGYKGKMKRFFLKKISRAYVSGHSQAELCSKLNFNGEVIKTRGVGIFNIQPQAKYYKKDSVKDFIYVGRLSPEKNLSYLIKTFNQFPKLSLNIIGYGPQEKYLRSIAGHNVFFQNAVPNSELYKIYRQNDVLVLPSISEPWGLVVEEALNNGLPVIVSNKVGCAEEIVNDSNGIVFNLDSTHDLFNAIVKMQDLEFYNNLRQNISRMNFEKIAEEQVNCYL